MPLRHDPRRGALLMLGACAVFAAMGVLVKLLGERLPVVELIFFRNALSLPIVLAFGLRGATLASVMRTRRPLGHLARAVVGLSAMGCSFFSLTVLPLAEHTALTHTTPLFATLLAVLLLGERPGLWRISALVAGFGGILVIAAGQGGFSGALAGPALAGLAAAVAHGVFSAGSTLLVRGLSASESSATIVFYQAVLMALIMSVFLPFVWVAPTPAEWLLLLALGLAGGLGQILVTEAYARAQVSAIAPYSYSTLLWAAGFGLLVFGDVPGASTGIGAAMIVGAGLVILYRDLRRRRGR
ncbi:MAG: DMT family transporter [Acetobacteraceae bacterium]|nr:DMT family transporter [Acetobacteraceae bacterium]MCX7685876.1 DMT family transporter [Acetobacteraceae bacterium]MDW8397149.1 DMT family transporter [Acetobacteraceae bacterium]